jgi:hypothetical protein
MSSVNTFPPYFSKIHFNNIFPFMPGSYKRYLPLDFPTKILYAFIKSPMHPTWSSQLVLLDLITVMEVYKLWNYSLCSFLQPSTTSSLLGPNIFLSTLFSNTFNLCSSLSVREQVSHPYKTTRKTVILYTLRFIDETGRQKILNWKVASIPRI